jgi:hypothetical protein
MLQKGQDNDIMTCKLQNDWPEENDTVGYVLHAKEIINSYDILVGD